MFGAANASIIETAGSVRLEYRTTTYTCTMNPMRHTMPALLTYDDYCLIPDDGKRYEVIHGELFMSPSPIFRHQRISMSLTLILGAYVEETGAGILVAAPMDVILSEHNVVQPDVLFISKGRTSIITEKNIQGAPDLLIEILSEGNRRHDEVVKRKVYESFGVQEYWVIDPVLETIKVYRLEGDRYAKAVELSVEQGDVLTTPLLRAFECTLADVFKI